MLKKNDVLFSVCAKCYHKVHGIFNRQYREVRRFYRNNGPKMTEECAALNENSVVFELGGYKGSWIKTIYEKYHCFCYVFEPVKEFYDVIQNTFSEESKVHVYNLGIGVTTQESFIGVSADGSSVYNEETNEKIQIKSLEEFCMENGIDYIDFMQMNIEGGEYDILEWLIESGNIKRIHVLQVQFHNRKEIDSKRRMRSIQSKLEKTHILEWAFRPYVWDRWVLK